MRKSISFAPDVEQLLKDYRDAHNATRAQAISDILSMAVSVGIAKLNESMELQRRLQSIENRIEYLEQVVSEGAVYE